jgi:hypothetical protein
MTLSAPLDADELALLGTGFPGFRLWREILLDRTRYVAQGRSLDTHPYAVVTDDLSELRTVLASGQRTR